MKKEGVAWLKMKNLHCPHLQCDQISVMFTAIWSQWPSLSHLQKGLYDRVRDNDGRGRHVLEGQHVLDDVGLRGRSAALVLCLLGRGVKIGYFEGSNSTTVSKNI